MSAFTVTVSNKAAKPAQLRADLDMHMQVCQSTDRSKMALYEANLAAFEGTTATRATHGKFLFALLGEVEHYQRTHGTHSPLNKELLQHLLKQHESLMAIFPDRDVYGQSVALIAQRRVFNAMMTPKI